MSYLEPSTSLVCIPKAELALNDYISFLCLSIFSPEIPGVVEYQHNSGDLNIRRSPISHEFAKAVEPSLWFTVFFVTQVAEG